MRCLGIDYGRRRIGLALSDPTLLIATPLGITTLVSEVQSKNAYSPISNDCRFGRYTFQIIIYIKMHFLKP